MNNQLVVIRGAGDLATGIGHKLHRSGFRVLMLEQVTPLVIRRQVAFASAIFEGSMTVEGVRAQAIKHLNEITAIWEQDAIAVMVDPQAEILKQISPRVLVDAILAKQNLGTNKSMAPLTIAVGPGFIAGKDVDVVIESQRGHDLGKLIFTGSAAADTRIPGWIMGYSTERIIRSPVDGVTNNIIDIGTQVKAGQLIGYVGDAKIIAGIDGVLRGLIRNGIIVKQGLKIADIDPRGKEEYCYTISDKARAIGGAVLEAILYLEKSGIHQHLNLEG